MLDIRNDTTEAARVESETLAAGEPDALATPAAPRIRRRLMDEISGAEALALVAFWLLATTLLSAIAPAPAADATQTPLNIGLNIAFNIGFIGALGGAATRRRLVFAGSMLAGGAMAVMATFCGLEGHTGLWIPAQFALGAGIFAYGARRIRT